MKLSRDSVVVGIDDSDSAREAAHFALAHFADAREIVLVAVIPDGTRPVLPAPSDVTTPYTGSLPAVQPATPNEEGRQKCQAMLDELRTQLEATREDSETTSAPIKTRVFAGDPAEQLAALGDDAGLLVIGHHGADQEFAGRIGRTSRGLPGHSLCPVLIYRSGDTGDSVVVGMDTSEYSSVAALDAADFAVNAGLPLRVVVGVDPLGDSERTHAQTEFDLSWLRSEVPGLDVSVEYAQGPAAEVLVAASSNARLLVMGKRGLGLFAGMAVQLGRTASQVIEKVNSSLMLVSFRDDPRLANRRIVD